MGTGKKKKDSGCGGSFWLFIIATGLVTVGVFTGTWPIMMIVAGILAVIGMILFILWIVADDKREKTLLDTPVSQLTPIQYEKYIGLYVQKRGYKNIRYTKATGDYGADVLCDYPEGRKVCIQCKHYSQPVGIQAVQEVIAAKEYYKCDEAWVCASNTYTPAAHKMASQTGVKLYTIK